MKKIELDELLNRGVLNNEEYEEFFKCMHVNDEGEMIGTLPCDEIYYKYELNGDISNLLDFVIKEVCPPEGMESFNKTFYTYGYGTYGVSDKWIWFKSDTITDYAKEHGHKPIEEASELELWKMVALSSRYWHVSYQRWLRDEEDRFEKYRLCHGETKQVRPFSIMDI